ncbi:MAG: hypothetical protein GEV08_24345 [Acidimicrobiia bacterium]|nr:hypothetical protein [Acidimicrobiia bacterium]
MAASRVTPSARCATSSTPSPLRSEAARGAEGPGSGHGARNGFPWVESTRRSWADGHPHRAAVRRRRPDRCRAGGVPRRARLARRRRAASPCPGWTVLGLACHVLGDDLGSLARDRDRHFGTPPPADADTADAFADWLDDLNRQWVLALRRLSPRLTVDLLRTAGDELVSMFREDDPRAVTAHVSWASDDPVPRWLEHGRELTERWLHHQQVLEAVGWPSWLDPGMLEAVLETLRWAYPFALRGEGRPPGTTAEVTVTGDLERTWRLVSSGEGWRFAAPSAAGSAPVAAPAASMRLPADVAWRLLSNNLPGGRHEAIELRGEAGLGLALQRARAIIGRSNGP